MDIFYFFFTLLFLLPTVSARKHHLSLQDDIRRFFKVSSFGYFAGGYLIVNVTQFSFLPPDRDAKFGFTLIRSISDSLSPLDWHLRQCDSRDALSSQEPELGLISIAMNFTNEPSVNITCSPSVVSLRISDLTEHVQSRDKRASNVSEDNNASNIPNPDRREEPVPNAKLEKTTESNVQANQPKITEPNPALGETSGENSGSLPNEGTNEVLPPISYQSQSTVDHHCSNVPTVIKMNILEADGQNVYNFAFRIFVTQEELEGLYSLFFYSCKNYEAFGYSWTRSNLTLDITESNIHNFLSAGEMPLPEMYFALSIIFFLLGVFWISVVKTKSQDAFKIHYIMGLLVFVKALALLFHGINYQFIAQEGSQSETWAILYYITHFLKGALLFITIVLIGTGWAFIKHILSEKDKNLFMVVIPLQVLANIAEIITEESEEGEVFHNKWREIFILVDLLCCGAILFPVVWSIRHLQEAAHIDGKAAVNLKKLKLFRRFYVIIVCYIYFTRIIVYLLKVTVPFKYEWMDVLISHAGIFVFFVLTGYHFQPTPQNPYFRVAQDEDLELEEVLFEVTPNVYTENLSKKRKHIVEVNCDDQEQLITKREASHDFD